MSVLRCRLTPTVPESRTPHTKLAVRDGLLVHLQPTLNTIGLEIAREFKRFRTSVADELVPLENAGSAV